MRKLKKADIHDDGRIMLDADRLSNGRWAVHLSELSNRDARDFVDMDTALKAYPKVVPYPAVRLDPTKALDDVFRAPETALAWYRKTSVLFRERSDGDALLLRLYIRCDGPGVNGNTEDVPKDRVWIQDRFADLLELESLWACPPVDDGTEHGQRPDHRCFNTDCNGAGAPTVVVMPVLEPDGHTDMRLLRERRGTA